MIVERGTVIGPAGAGRVWVETRRHGVCGACEARSGCGIHLLGEAGGGRRNRVAVLAEAGCEPGEVVELGLREHALLLGSAMVYLVPLCGLFAGAVLALAAFGPAAEGAALVGGLLGLALGLAHTRRFARRIARDPRFQPVILRHAGVAASRDRRD